MNRLSLLLFCLLLSVFLSAQQGLKPAPNSGATPTNIDLNKLDFWLNRQRTVVRLAGARAQGTRTK